MCSLYHCPHSDLTALPTQQQLHGAHSQLPTDVQHRSLLLRFQTQVHIRPLPAYCHPVRRCITSAAARRVIYGKQRHNSGFIGADLRRCMTLETQKDRKVPAVLQQLDAGVDVVGSLWSSKHIPLCLAVTGSVCNVIGRVCRFLYGLRDVIACQYRSAVLHSRLFILQHHPRRVVARRPRLRETCPAVVRHKICLRKITAPRAQRLVQYHVSHHRALVEIGLDTLVILKPHPAPEGAPQQMCVQRAGVHLHHVAVKDHRTVIIAFQVYKACPVNIAFTYYVVGKQHRVVIFYRVGPVHILVVVAVDKVHRGVVPHL